MPTRNSYYFRSRFANVKNVLINPASSRLHASTIQIKDPGPLLKFLTPDGVAFGNGLNSVVGVGEVARLETKSIDEAAQWWATLSATLENETEMPGKVGVGPLALGSFLFDPDASAQKSVLVVPETLIGHRDGIYWLTKIGYDRVEATLPAVAEPASAPGKVSFTSGQLDETAWMQKVEQAVAHIRAGQAEKIVLARDICGECEDAIDPRWVFNNLLVEYRNSWNYLVDGLVGSSPEILVRRENGLTTSRVLAGTMPRLEEVPDTAQAARLIASNKDMREHRYAVTSVIDALKPLLKGMHAPEAPYILTLPNLLHLATDICGVSDPDTNTLTLAGAAHPTAAVCGTPTADAKHWIAEHESMDRGRYAGPVGWMDAQGDGEWALALRCGQIHAADPRKISLFAGAGIVAESRPHSELVETETKLALMKSALRGADYTS